MSDSSTVDIKILHDQPIPILPKVLISNLELKVTFYDTVYLRRYSAAGNIDTKIALNEEFRKGNAPQLCLWCS